MKTMKRVLGILLALALVLTLALPAMAAEPVITDVSPERLVARTGESITLTVEAEGAETYQWYQWVDDDWEEIAGATAKSLTITANIEEFTELDDLFSGLKKKYCVVVFGNGDQISADITVVFVPGFFDSFRGMFRYSENFAYQRGVNRLSFILGEIFLLPFLLFAVLTICLAGTLSYYSA